MAKGAATSSAALMAKEWWMRLGERGERSVTGCWDVRCPAGGGGGGGPMTKPGRTGSVAANRRLSWAVSSRFIRVNPSPNRHYTTRPGNGQAREVAALAVPATSITRRLIVAEAARDAVLVGAIQGRHGRGTPLERRATHHIGRRSCNQWPMDWLGPRRSGRSEWCGRLNSSIRRPWARRRRRYRDDARAYGIDPTMGLDWSASRPRHKRTKIVRQRP